MALNVKSNEFVVLCIHVPGTTEQDLLVVKASLDGKSFCNIPLDKQAIKFHPEIMVSYEL